MRRRGRPVLGTISGFVFGLFLGITLLTFGALPLNSPVLTILPVAGLVVGLVLALTAPLGRRSAGGGGSSAPASGPGPMPT